MNYHERGCESLLWIPVHILISNPASMHRIVQWWEWYLKMVGWSKTITKKKLKRQKMIVGNERLESFSICPQSFIKRHFFIWLFFILSSIQSYLYFPTANSGSFDMQNLFSFNVQKSNNTEYSLPFIVPTIETVNSENVTLW